MRSMRVLVGCARLGPAALLVGAIGMFEITGVFSANRLITADCFGAIAMARSRYVFWIDIFTSLVLLKFYSTRKANN